MSEQASPHPVHPGTSRPDAAPACAGPAMSMLAQGIPPVKCSVGRVRVGRRSHVIYRAEMDLGTIVAVSWWMIVPLVLLGSILHFLYDWTGHNRIAAIFGAVNESYWEHIKIAVWPVALLQLVLFLSGGHRYPSFIPAATVALYSIPISMVGLVFLYKSFTKRNVLWLDIGVFAAVIVIAQVLFVQLLEQLDPAAPTVILAALFLVGLILAFLKFTLHPPQEPDVFIDPITQKYGLHGHPDVDPPAEPRDEDA